VIFLGLKRGIMNTTRGENNKITAKKYRELFRLRAEGKLDSMECTKSLYKILEGVYFDGMRILDIPCGVGHYFRKISELDNIHYVGVDRDLAAIEIAKDIWRDSPNTRFYVQDIFNCNLEDNHFDVVYSYNFLLHLNDYKAPLRELFRVCKRHLIVRSLFNEESSVNSYSVAEDYLNVYPSGKVYHNTYARESIKEFLGELGQCRIKFMKDNSLIPQEGIEKQARLLSVDPSEFSMGGNGKKEYWKGSLLNYEVLFIEKSNRRE